MKKTMVEIIEKVANGMEVTAEEMEICKEFLAEESARTESANKKKAEAKKKKEEEDAPLREEAVEVIPSGVTMSLVDIASAVNMHPTKVMYLLKPCVADGILEEVTLKGKKKGYKKIQ